MADNPCCGENPFEWTVGSKVKLDGDSTVYTIKEISIFGEPLLVGPDPENTPTWVTANDIVEVIEV